MLVHPGNPLRWQRDVRHLCRLGPRAVAEFLTEVATAHPVIADDMATRLETYSALQPARLLAVQRRWCSGRSFPPVMSSIRGGRP